MANNPFDRNAMNQKERPVSRDANQTQSQLDASLRLLVDRLCGARDPFSAAFGSSAGNGFAGDSFRVLGIGAMQLFVARGLGFQDGAGDQPTDIGGLIGLDDRQQVKPLMLANDEALNVPAADPGLPRIDIVEVRYNRALGGALARDILNATTGIFSSIVVDKTLTFALDGLSSINGAAAINYKTGVPAGVPVPPATSAGYVRIAEVTVAAAVVGLTDADIADVRPLLFPGGIVEAGFSCSIDTSVNPPVISNLTVVAPPGVQIVVAPWADAIGGAANPRGIRFFVYGGKGWAPPARTILNVEVGTRN